MAKSTSYQVDSCIESVGCRYKPVRITKRVFDGVSEKISEVTQEIRDGMKQAEDEIEELFFKGETHAAANSLEIKNITSFDDNTVYLRYELRVGYERPTLKV